jgi:hypothetical protein
VSRERLRRESDKIGRGEGWRGSSSGRLLTDAAILGTEMLSYPKGYLCHMADRKVHSIIGSWNKWRSRE